MGGDNFPSANIDGVFDYLENKNSSDIHFMLVGNQTLIEKYLSNKNKSHDSISIINAIDIIDDTDKPSRVFKTKPNSSIVRSIELLKNKKNQH